MNENEKVMLSIPVVHEKTGITKPLLRELCKDGKIPCMQVGNRKYLINYPELLKKLASNELKMEG